MDDKFELWLPLEKGKIEGKDDRHWIKGLASDESMDLQQEKVIAKGIDFETYFLKYGYFNYDHLVRHQGPKYIVGEPTEGEIVKIDDGGVGFFVKGFLYKGKEVADDLWDLINVMNLNKSRRRLGFSIEGKVLKRKSGKVLKSLVMHCAITHQPINVNSYLEPMAFLKGLDDQEWCACLDKPECVHCDSCQKALDIGYNTDSSTYQGGRALTTEDLEGDTKSQVFALDTVDSMVEYLVKNQGYNKQTAKVLVEGSINLGLLPN